MAKRSETVPAKVRQARIRELLKDNHTVSIKELAKEFAVSEMTVRRDLEVLERAGEVRRTHGGAMPADRMVFQFDFTARRQAHKPAKIAIARRALEVIKPHKRIIIDTGTTTLELAYLLKEEHDITVLTPSLAVASVLQFSPGVQTVLLGGVVRRGSPDLTGVVTETVLDMFAADIAFQGADGIGIDGRLYNADTRIAKVDRKIRERAERTYILSDSSKIGKTALITHGYINEVEALITDWKIDPAHKKSFEEKGATVIAAGQENKNRANINGYGGTA